MNEVPGSSDVTTIPMLIQAPTSSQFHPLIVLHDGSSKQTIKPPKDQYDTIWFVVFDRSSLEVLWQDVTNDVDNVPAKLKELDVDTNMLVTVFNAKRPNALPQGALYDFLVDCGAGPVLNRLEQVGAQLMCGVDGFIAYSLAGIMGPGLPANGAVEAGTPMESVALNLITLVGVEIDGKVSYTPTPTT